VSDSDASPTQTHSPASEGEGESEGEVDLEKLRELWPAVVDSLRDSGQELLSTLLEAARPVAVDVEEAVLKVGFPPAAAFNKRKAEATDARDRFTEAVRSIVGERLRPVFVLLEGEEQTPGTVELTPDELIERFKSEFDAEEIEASEADPGNDAREATG
jgi:hypothetical protein